MGFDKGLTFLEIVIALFLFAVAMLGFLQIFNTALDASHRATQEIIATNLARGLMAEIMSKNFEEPGSDPANPPSLGPDSGELSRSDYDDVDDWYAGGLWSESPPVTVGGDPMDGTVPGVPNYSGFTRSVNVGYCTIDGSNNIIPDPGPTEYKHITVTASGPYVRDVIVDEVKTR